jgi:bifunctional NMN adenylyltransferase/nudix hydrolase
VTVDAVIVRSGHVLVVRRKHTPGKGLLAVPGGFLNPEEQILDGTIREVLEETNFTRPTKGEKEFSSVKAMLVDGIVTTQVFSHPDRSLRGRVITHATLFNLGNGQLPIVRGGDDAEDAFWMPVHEVYSHPERFFDDHSALIASMLKLV